MSKIRKTRLNRSLGGNLLVALILLVVGAFMFLPLFYIVVSSLKPLSEFFYFPPRFFVQNPTLKNYSELLNDLTDTTVPFLRYLFNTLFISIVGTAGHVVIASMCAYALAKHVFPGRNAIFQIIVTSLMFNAAVMAVPSFLIVSSLHLIDTYWAYIIPAFGLPLGLYLMKQFIEQMVPDAVLESAKMDGCGEWRMIWRIVMPMVKPAWLTLIIFAFQGLWNVGTTQYIFQEKLKTINYALSQILAGGIARTGVGTAVSVVMLIVPIVVFMVTQNSVVETMSTSGMKE